MFEVLKKLFVNAYEALDTAIVLVIVLLFSC